MPTINNLPFQFDVIVIGGGHAGVEAAAAAARMGVKTALITLRKDRIGFMPCNPSLGGIGKGHIVFEISALGGLMPQVGTKTYLDAKMLNTRKGPAVQGLRLQIDKHAYCQAIQQHLATMEHLTIIEGMVDEVLFNEDKAVHGIQLADGTCYRTKNVVLTGGTFLNGLVHIGEESYPAGRREEAAVIGLAQKLRDLGLTVQRMKTGTPARLLRSSVNVAVMERDVTPPLEYLFDFFPHHAETKLPCYITHTNEQTHKIIFDNAHRSPIFSKKITGTPTRYCPSIEDKVVRFAHKTSHHVFVEPESASSEELYPNGISNSLPKDVQEDLIHSIKGFENAVITQYAYGIEYDFVQPNQLNHTLELKAFPGFFLAGQINGTTGYEEAAGQGIIAGINAACKAKGIAPYSMSRNEGYIGIMIDDLVSMGVDEPYRMFTSRAERRLLLRQDNAFSRLYKKSFELGLITQELHDAIAAEDASVQQSLEELHKKGKFKKLAQLVSNNDPQFIKDEIVRSISCNLSPRALETVFAELLYGPYKQRELKEIEKNEVFKTLVIPPNFSYQGMPGLSRELQEKLMQHKPSSVAQAALIKGMTPASLSLLIFRIREQAKNTTTHVF